jgi:hypothetical protein
MHGLKNRAMNQAASRRPPTPETRVCDRVCPCGISGKKNWHWERIFSKFFGFTLSLSFHRSRPYSYVTWGMNNRPQGDGSLQTHSRPSRAFSSGKGPPVPIVQEAGWDPEPVWIQRLQEKSLASAGDRTSISRSSSPYPDTILAELPRLPNKT